MALNLKKVLISDDVDKKCTELLTANGIEVVCKYKLSEDELIKELSSCNGLIVRSDTKVTKRVIESTKHLTVIGRAGVGVDNIDLDAATRKGVIVLNAPSGNSISACELTCSFITCVARSVTESCQSMKEGRWDRKLYAGGAELYGKTLAIIGLGRIGKEVALRMKTFGMNLLGFDPAVTEEAASLFHVKKMTLSEIWPIADYITVHTPLIPATKNLINESTINQCKKGVKIINVARGGIINEQDLLNALKDGRCGGAALDVYSEEPPKSEILRQLISHPKVIATPHLGASTKEAQIRVAVEVAEQFVSLNDVTSKYKVTGVINAPALLASRRTENTTWIELAEQLGRVVSQMAGGTIKGAKIQIGLSGQGIQHMNFLSTSALVGVLSANVKNGFNLINSHLHAKEAGLEVLVQTLNDEKIEVSSTENSGNVLDVSLQNNGYKYSAQGTVTDKTTYLLKVNDASFAPGYIQLSQNLKLVSCELEKVQAVVGAAFSSTNRVSNISIAYGEKAWIALQYGNS